MKLYSYIGIGKYLGLCQNISSREPSGAQSTLCKFETPIISETPGASKLKLKTQLDVVKYKLRVQTFFRELASRGRRAN